MTFTLPAFAPEESQSWRTHCNMDSKCSSSLLSSSSWASFRSATGWSSHRDLKQIHLLKCHPQLKFPDVPIDGANGEAVVGGELVHAKCCSVSLWAEQEQPHGFAYRHTPLYTTFPIQASTFQGSLLLELWTCEWRGLFLCLPDKPPTSIFFRFLASRIQMVSLPAVGT